MIGLLVIILPFLSKARYGTEFEFNQQIIIIISVITLVMNIPAVLIYLNYYFENKNTSFILDHSSKKITIIKNGSTKEYQQNDVETSIYHLGIYYKNAIDRAGRIPMFISDFGYWELKFKNGENYYLSNILHDFIHDEPFLDNTKYRFRMFTYIKKSDSKEAIQLKRIKDKNSKKRRDRLRELYSQKSLSELKYIVENQDLYMENAREVAGEIIKERTNKVE